MYDCDLPVKNGLFYTFNKWICKITGDCPAITNEQFWDWTQIGKTVHCYYCNRVLHKLPEEK